MVREVEDGVGWQDRARVGAGGRMRLARAGAGGRMGLTRARAEDGRQAGWPIEVTARPPESRCTVAPSNNVTVNSICLDLVRLDGFLFIFYQVKDDILRLYELFFSYCTTEE